jgi:predicted porin
MKKSLLSLAVGAAMVLPAMASADVMVYGLAQVELANISPEGTCAAGDTSCDSYLNLLDNANGRVGVSASEDLGNGWTGLAKFEYKIDTADGAADDGVSEGATGVDLNSDGDTKDTVGVVGLTPREVMVGLKGKDVGQFELGRLKSPYKYAGGVKYDPFVATGLEARGQGGMHNGAYGQGGFLSNTIAYRGAFGPVKVELLYGPETNDGQMGLSAMYAADNFEVGVAMIDSGDIKAKVGGLPVAGTNAALPTSEYGAESNTKLFGKYTMGMHTIVAQYEMIDLTPTNPTAGRSTKGDKPTYMFLGYQAKMGANQFVVEYGSMSADDKTTTIGGAAKSNDMTMLVLGVNHFMSKTTRMYAGYRNSTSDAENGNSVITVGLRKDFK